MFPRYEAPENSAQDSKDEALLREIRDFREYAESRWDKIRKESAKDRRYISGDPWDDADRRAREEAGRPCINHDELGQYVNQAVNNVRANKRGIKVEPAGNNATDKTAEFRQGLIRGIEYKSKAQQAYINAFKSLVESRYGFFRISRQYVSQAPDAPDDQEIVVKPIINPDSVLYDPDCKEADWSDARRVLVLDPWPKEDFKARFPKARITDFAATDNRIRMHWIQDKVVVVGEYWRVHSERMWNLAKTRQVERKWVCKYLTNGLEILETEEFLTADGQPIGEHIPIIPMFGPQRYVDRGAGPELEVSSLVGLAREPQLSLAFLVSQQIEEAGLAPRIPFIGYEGQFATNTDWAHIHKVPTAYAEVKASTEQTGAALLPLPHFAQFTPNTQAYEVAKDSFRRAIQAAMGISPLPTAAQRQNEKSGIALQRIQQQTQIGSFHFNDIYENALEYAGRLIDSWIPFIYDTPRDAALRQPDDTGKVVRINEPFQDGEEVQNYSVDEGDHAITVSTGPSNESQRDAASEFLDTLVSNLAQLPPPGSPPAKLLALTIRMKQLGPIGDQMADIMDPPEGDGQQAAALQQSQMQMQAMQEGLVKLQAELQKLQLEKAGRVIDNQAKAEIERMKIEADIAKAEIMTKAQKDSERLALLEDLVHKLMDQGHAAALQASAQQHEQNQAAQQAETAAQQQAADQSHQMTMAEQQAQQQDSAE